MSTNSNSTGIFMPNPTNTKTIKQVLSSAATVDAAASATTSAATTATATATAPATLLVII